MIESPILIDESDLFYLRMAALGWLKSLSEEEYKKDQSQRVVIAIKSVLIAEKEKRDRIV